MHSRNNRSLEKINIHDLVSINLPKAHMKALIINTESKLYDFTEN